LPGAPYTLLLLAAAAVSAAIAAHVWRSAAAHSAPGPDVGGERRRDGRRREK